MENDKAFAWYAAFIAAGTITVVTAAVVTQGGSFPPMAFLVEHLALSLLFRSAYKSFDGSNWVRSALTFADLIGRDEEAAAPTAAPAAEEAQIAKAA